MKIQVRATVRLQVFMEDGTEKYDVATTSEHTTFAGYRATPEELMKAVRAAAKQGLIPLQGNAATQAMVALGPDEVGEIKRQALGIDLAASRDVYHVYDDGEMADHCLICGMQDEHEVHFRP